MADRFEDQDVNVLAFPKMNPALNDSSDSSDPSPVSVPSEDYIPDSEDSERAHKTMKGTHDSPPTRRISIKRKKNVPN